MSTNVIFIGMEDDSLVFQVDDEIIFKIYSFYRGVARIKCDKVNSIDEVALVIKSCFNSKTKLNGLKKVVVLYNDIPIVATRETCRKEQIIKRYNKEFNKRGLKQGMIFKSFKLQEEWEKWKNDKEYSLSFEIAEDIANKFQDAFQKGIKLEEVANEIFNDVKKRNNSDDLLFKVIVELVLFWKYGEQIVEWSKTLS